jgi:hypothetical protein
MWFGIGGLLFSRRRLRGAPNVSRRGSSYFFAEQAFLRKTKAYRFARMAFITGWASHLYYWVYPAAWWA